MSGLLRTVGALAIVVGLAAPAAAQQPVPAGHVKTVTGAAFVVRGQSTTPVKPGDAIFASDTLRTDGDGAVGITMRDDTRLSLGPNSEVRVDRYVYAPGEGGLGMTTVLGRVGSSSQITRATSISIRVGSQYGRWPVSNS